MVLMDSCSFGYMSVVCLQKVLQATFFRVRLLCGVVHSCNVTAKRVSVWPHLASSSGYYIFVIVLHCVYLLASYGPWGYVTETGNPRLCISRVCVPRHSPSKWPLVDRPGCGKSEELTALRGMCSSDCSRHTLINPLHSAAGEPPGVCPLGRVPWDSWWCSAKWKTQKERYTNGSNIIVISSATATPWCN